MTGGFNVLYIHFTYTPCLPEDTLSLTVGSLCHMSLLCRFLRRAVALRVGWRDGQPAELSGWRKWEERSKPFLKNHSSSTLPPAPFFRAAPEAYGSSQARGQIGVQLPAYATATATPDLTCSCNLHHSSQQCWNLNPLSKVWDQSRILMDTSQVHYLWATAELHGPLNFNFTFPYTIRVLKFSNSQAFWKFQGANWIIFCLLYVASSFTPLWLWLRYHLLTGHLKSQPPLHLPILKSN